MIKRNEECVKVAIRCRPFTDQEKLDNRIIIVQIN